MTQEETKTLVKKLRERSSAIRTYTTEEIMRAIFDGPCPKDLVMRILEEANPDTHVELPKDADGMAIHVGDELYAYDRKCKCVELQLQRDNSWVVETTRNTFTDETLDDVRHHRMLTIEETLSEFGAKWNELDSEELITDYAEKIKEIVEERRL